MYREVIYLFIFFFQAEDGIRDWSVTGVQTCALPISRCGARSARGSVRGAGRARAGRRVARNPARRKARRGASRRSEERRVGKRVDLGGGRNVKKKNERDVRGMRQYRNSQQNRVSMKH